MWEAGTKGNNNTITTWEEKLMVEDKLVNTKFLLSMYKVAWYCAKTFTITTEKDTFYVKTKTWSYKM